MNAHQHSPLSVVLRDVSRAFNGPSILDRVSLRIEPGQFVALLGESGSGKTTLLRALAGLDQDATRSGTISAPDNVSVLFQDARLLPWLSVAENLSLGLRRADRDVAVPRMLQAVGLADKADVWPNTLSGGQKQRAALARSLLREPALLLADEPFGALDALTRLRMQALLFQLVEQRRPTVILVTHDVDEALLLADRILVLKDGRIQEDHSIALPHPRQPHQADFALLRLTLLRSLGVETAVI
jgi:sulfonate transport system ATP-binding protein